MTDDTKQIIQKLLQDHVGEGNGITQAQLKDALGLSETAVRDEIAALRERDEPPCIGNFGNGYFVIASEDSLQDFIAQQNREIQTRRERIEHVHSAFTDFDGEVATDEPDDSQEVQEPTYECRYCGKDVAKSDVRRPKAGEWDGKVLCKQHYGRWLMNGKSLDGEV